MLDVQNMETLLMRNNLIEGNQGGLRVQSDSSGVPTALKAILHNNVLSDNVNGETLMLQVGLWSLAFQLVGLW